MAKNKYFKNYTSNNEQSLIERQYDESVRIHGMDMFYIPRNIIEMNDTFREATITTYERALETVAYIDSAESYGGQGMFLSRFGTEFRDEITVSLPTLSFRIDIGTQTGFTVPRAGDLIWFPLGKNLFQIMDRKDYDPFYQLGTLVRHQLIAQLFEYSNETFNTGIPEIDDLYNAMDYREDLDAEIPEIDDSILNFVDPQSMNKYVQDDSDDIINQALTQNPFGQP